MVNMNLQPSPIRLAPRPHRARAMFVFLLIPLAVTISAVYAAQADAPGEPVIIPGMEIPGFGQVDEVLARFGRPAGSSGKTPAVLILHGGSGVDGRGAFYAKALQEAGIATLEITMFQFGRRPKAGPQATMPHAAAALGWLGKEPSVDSRRLGVMGFSWGGLMTVLLSSELVQEKLGKDMPRPVAFAPLYPVCSAIARMVKNPDRACYNAQTRMSASPMLISVGADDDYEDGKRPCDTLIAMWPARAREQATVRCIEGATHAFDSQNGGMRFYDVLSHAGRGGMVSIVPSPKDAAETRKAVTDFFVKCLKP
jgi:dienelactone hydrolase